MLNQFLISMVLTAHILGLTLPQLIEEGVYMVPTTISDAAGERQEERILPAVPDAVVTQAQPVSVVENRFLPTPPDAIFLPTRVGTSTQPNTSAGSAVLMDVATGMVLWQKNPDTIRPIASITKLMTALVYLDHQPSDGMNHVHTLAPEDNAVVGYNLTFPAGTQITTGSLFGAMLVGSLNNTARALNGATGISQNEFVADMNQTARSLGMQHATFVDQTGVNAADQATVGDVALMAKQAFTKSDITQYAQIDTLEVHDVSGAALRTIHATDHLLDNPDLHIQGAKTGTTDQAGFCFVFQVLIEGHSVIGVILGDTSDANRFSDAERMIEWTSAQFDWK